MTPRKWRLVRMFDSVVRLLVPLLPSPRPLGNCENEPKSILIIEYWNLGDLVILVPFLRNLRQSFPGARIALVVNAGLASFLKGQGLVDEFIPVRVPWTQFSRRKKYNPLSSDWISLARILSAVRKRKFDWAISGRMDIRDNFLLWLSGAGRRIGYGFGGGGFLLTDRVMPDLSRPHRVDTWLRLLEVLGKHPERDVPQFQLTHSEINSAEAFMHERGIPTDAFLIGIHPGARIATRRWGDERFAQVAEHLVTETDAHIVWFSDPQKPSDGPSLERCHTASLDFRSFMALLSRCHVFVCNDSGPMHVANLLRVPVVAVFGSTNPIWFGPRGAEDRVVIRPEFWCRPCFDYCIYDQPYCLRTISVEEVFGAVNAVCRLAAGRMPERTQILK